MGLLCRGIGIVLGLSMVACGGGGGSSAGGAAVPSSPVAVTEPSVTALVEGLPSGGSMKLVLGVEELAVTASGQVGFKTNAAAGTPYSVYLKEVPSGLACAVTDGAGVVGVSPAKSVQVRCAPVSGTEAFKPVPQRLVDLEPLYASFCPKEVADNRSMQHVVPVDLNRDGRMDLIVYIWCSPVVGGQEFTGPTPSRIRAFLQDTHGNFLDKTRDVFGVDDVQPGGVGEYYVTGDFNGDGYTDIIWSLNREDGRRIQNPPVTQYVRGVALLSRGDGRYAMEMFGNPAWGFGVTAFDNASGGKDFIMASVSEGQKAWTYAAPSGLTPLSGYEWVDSTGPLFFERPRPGTGSQMAILTVHQPSRIGLELFLRSDAGWLKSTGGFGYAASMIKKLCCNNLEPSGAVFVQLDGKDYIDPSFGFTCALRRTPQSAPEAITVFEANEILGGYTGQVVVYNQTPLLELFKLMAFGIGAGNSLERRPLTIRNEVDRNVLANRMTCGDINGDGYDDIVLHVTKSSQVPLVYLNDKAGNFDRVAPQAWPRSTNGERASNYILADMDADGVADLIYFPINAYAGAENRILVHKGLRALRTNDVMP